MILRIATVYLIGFCMLVVLNCSETDPTESLNRGLIAYYPFNGTADDHSGNDNDGSVIGPQLTTDRYGRDSSAYHFDGSGDRINIPHSEILNIEGSLSISVWIKPERLGSNECIVFRGDNVPGKDTYYIRVLDYNTLDFLVGSVQDPADAVVGTYDFGLSQISINSWSHLVITFQNGHALSLFINGTMVNTRQTLLDNRGADRDMDLFIGSAGSTQNFYGDIDEVRIYNRAISANEAAALFSFED